MYRTETFGCDAARKNRRRGEGHAQAEGLGVCKETTKNKIAVGRHAQPGTWEAACIVSDGRFFLNWSLVPTPSMFLSQSGTSAQVDLQRICFLTDSNMLVRSRDIDR